MLAKDASNNNESMKYIDGGVNECKSIDLRDRCELASKLRSCLDKSNILHALNQM